MKNYRTSSLVFITGIFRCAAVKQLAKSKKSSNVQVINVKGEKTEKPKEKSETKTDKAAKSEDKAE